MIDLTYSFVFRRFKKNSTPSPRSVINASSSSSSSIPTGNSVNSKTNERKRSGAESSTNYSPPSKRLSTQQKNNYSHSTGTIGDLCSPPKAHRPRRRRRPSSSSSSCSSSSSSSLTSSQKDSSPRQTYTPNSSMDDLTWKKEVDKFLAKTSQPKHFSPSNPVLSQPVPLLSLRPTYIPPLLPLSQHKRPSTPRHQPPFQRPRQSLSNFNKRSSAPVVSGPSSQVQAQAQPKTNEPIRNQSIDQVPAKPIVEASSISVEKLPSNDTPTIQSSAMLQDEENELLELDEPTDVVDTFALIDEALFETDFELM